MQVLDTQPVEDFGRASRIPDALGGGYLFIGERTVRFAPAFDAPLLVLGSTSAEAGELRVGVGHKCVLLGTDQSSPILYALPSGTKLEPSLPGLAQLFGTPPGLVAARTSSGELFVSLANGASFTKLAATQVVGLRYDGKGIVVDTPKEQLRLDFAGSLGPRPSEPGMIVASNVDAFLEPFPDPSTPPPARTDVERLVDPLTKSMSAEVAITVRDSDLLFLDGTTGKVVHTEADAFTGRSNCFIVRGGRPSFVGCNGEAMALFRIESPRAKPVLEREIPGTYSHDFGEPAPGAPLVFAKRCDGSERTGALCLRQAPDRWQEWPPPPDPQGLLARVPFVVHAAASREGAPYAFGWLDGDGDLVIIDGRANQVRRIVKSAVPSWAGSGVDWHSLAIEAGTLRFMLSNAGPSQARAGIVEIRPDGTVRASELEGRVSAVGSRALQLTLTGQLRETLDAGRTFQRVAPPPGGVLGAGDDFFRCVETGCEIGPWYRVGWGRLKSATSASVGGRP